MKTPQRFLAASVFQALALAPLVVPLVAPAIAHADSVVVTNVRIEVGDGTVIENGAVFIDGETISKVGATLPVPRGARVIDGKGGVLSPGFVDVESNVGVREVSMEDATTDYEDRQSPWTPGFRPALAFDPNSVRLPINRQGGLTSAVLAPDGGVLSGTASWAALTGAVNSRPTEDDDSALFVSVGESASPYVGNSRGALWTSLREIVEDARLYARKPSEFDRRAVRPLAMSPVHLRAVQRALTGEIAFAARADKMADILSLLDFAQWVKTSSNGKEALRVVVVGGAEAWIVRDRLAKENVPVVIDPMEDGPHAFSRLRTHPQAAALLHAANVPLVLYVSGWFENGRRLRQVAGNAVAQGLSHEAAMMAVTKTPRSVFGAKTTSRAPRGVIAPGAPADVVLWTGDPFELSTVARVVFIGGRAHSLDTRQDQLARRYFRKPRPAKAVKASTSAKQ